jgi:hypothetical protein
MSSHATKFGVLISSNWDDLKERCDRTKRRPKYNPKQVMDFTHTIVSCPFQHMLSAK